MRFEIIIIIDIIIESITKIMKNKKVTHISARFVAGFKLFVQNFPLCVYYFLIILDIGDSNFRVFFLGFEFKFNIKKSDHWLFVFFLLHFKTSVGKGLFERNALN